MRFVIFQIYGKQFFLAPYNPTNADMKFVLYGADGYFL